MLKKLDSISIDIESTSKYMEQQARFSAIGKILTSMLMIIDPHVWLIFTLFSPLGMRDGGK